MRLVWYQWVSFVELFVTRRTNPEGFSGRKQHRCVGRSWKSSAYGLRDPGSWNLPVLPQQNLAVGFTFCPSATVL